MEEMQRAEAERMEEADLDDQLSVAEERPRCRSQSL